MTETTTISTLAAEAAKWFETAERKEGETYLRRKDGAPEWVSEMVRKAHGSMLPDDWRYDFIVQALCALEADGEDATLEADIYNHELQDWFGSHSDRVAFTDQALEDGLASAESGIMSIISMGQYLEKSEVLGIVRDFLEARLGALEEAAEEASTAPDEDDEE